ncbi:hypothetical protein [Kineococcus sp. SYSU DK018]|uniref:hypothetical protein n=1 Tax=Kineococcus sp. SYSU DK018 TaxID=3383139 RepID=UPI003D7E4431
MASKDAPAAYRILTADTAAVASLLQHVHLTVDGMREGESLQHYTARRREVLQRDVAAVMELTKSLDAFDVLQHLRRREFPPSAGPARESTSDGSMAALEIAALILRSRGVRSPQTSPDNAEPAPDLLERLHRHCHSILRMGTLSSLVRAASEEHGPLTRLAAGYYGHELNVRCKQYPQIEQEVHQRLFAAEPVSAMMHEALGFTYEDFTAVRAAIGEHEQERLSTALDTLQEVTQDWQARGRTQQPAEVIARGQRAAYDLLQHPGRLMSFTSADITARSELPERVVEAVLALFSVPFDGTDATTHARTAEEVVEAYLHGENPLRQGALLLDKDGNHITVGVPIGTDSLRPALEEALRASPARIWEKYDRHRAHVSEQLSVQHLRTLLGGADARTGVTYFRPRQGVGVDALGPEATDITELAQLAEADALAVVEDVAICLEVKAGSISAPARAGRVRRLARDLEKTVSDAAAQADRLRQLITVNGGLWLQDRTWLDLSGVREVRCITVLLDDLGPVGTALNELKRAGVLRTEQLPWVVSLHDLATTAQVLTRPAEFLLYLRRRIDSEVAVLFDAVDELDLLMLFCSGELYAEADPDAVAAVHPESPPPSAGDRRRYRRQRVPTRVYTQTDPLDAWMLADRDDTKVPKPRFTAESAVERIVDLLQEDRHPGWFRFGADLLHLSSATQIQLGKSLKELAARTRADRRPHTLVHSYAGAWGHPTLFVGTRPKGASLRAAARTLEEYVLAKRHQVASDRSLVLLIEESATIVASWYLNAVPQPDDVLDQLEGTMGLHPPQRASRVIPPSARRATRQLRGKKGRKR